MSWWRFGLVGGGALSATTAIRAAAAVLRGEAGRLATPEALGFAAAIFGVGFLCGLIVWAGQGLYERLGMAGNAIVGLAVMVSFFLCCMLLFDPELLAEWFTTAGLPMLGLAVVAGLVGLDRRCSRHSGNGPTFLMPLWRANGVRK